MGKNLGRREIQLFRGNVRGVVILLALAALLAGDGIGPVRTGVAFGLLASGCLFHLLVKGQLIRNVVLCSEGAYAIVRHPYYFANFVIDASFCVMSGSEPLLIAFPFLFHWGYGTSLSEEEELLESIHGEAYRAYRAKAPQLFPTSGAFGHLRVLFTSFTWSRITSNEWKRILRLASTAGLLAFVGQVGGARGLGTLLAADAVAHLKTDLGALVTGGLAAACFLLTLLIPRRRKDANPAAPPAPATP
jgi:hypothetical protein